MNPTVRHLVTTAIAAACLASSGIASAQMSKEQCLDAHSRGQDAKEQNKLSLARKLFLTCAQPSCPAIVQGDCARFADELEQLQPSVTFVARDASGNDLPDTTVYVDGSLVVTHLDGAMHDIDPGSHVVRFQSGGKEQIVTVVIGGGEKGRAIEATFGSPPLRSHGSASPDALAVTAKPVNRTTHARGAKLMMWGGAALVAGGAVLAVVGSMSVPSNCDVSTQECAAPPGDPAFGKAASAVRMADYGWALGITGVVAIGGGVMWYLTSAHHVGTDHVAVVPWLSGSGGGLAVTGAMR